MQDRPGTQPAPAREWWRAFFTESFGPLQRAGLRDELVAEEADFLERALDLQSPRVLLDVPCGAGRHAVELAVRGHTVTGVDFNPDVLASARKRAVAKGARLELREADMRRLADATEAGVYDGAYCYWGSFGYFDTEGDRAFLAGVYRALRPEGRFLVDTHVAESLLPKFQPRKWSWVGEGEERIQIIEERDWDLDSSRVDTTWTFLAGDGPPVRQVSSIRVYGFQELRQLLAAGGFTAFDARETGTWAPFKVGCNRLALIGIK
jgi:SAM-dependent methyltransferase